MKKYELKEFDIWMQGYSATGEYSQAQYIGKFSGRNFQDACMRFFMAKELESRKNYDLNDEYFDTARFDYNGHSNSYWSRKLFDNEVDARKMFG
jgi:hypothetical protein